MQKRKLILEKLHIYDNVHIISRKLPRSKINKHRVRGYSLFKRYSFDKSKKIKIWFLQKGRLYEEFLSKPKRAHNKQLCWNATKKEKKLIKKRTFSRFNEQFNEDENYRKVQDSCCFTGKDREVEQSILRQKTRKEAPVVLHNGFNYDYHIIIKELVEEFGG